MDLRKNSLDQIIDRKHTNSLKYDFATRKGLPADVLPLWVADMDFQTAKPILDAMCQRVEHGIFGYTEVIEGYFEPIKKWMKQRHDWDVEPNWLVKTPGVVFAIAMAIQAFTKEGDAVLIQRPVYYPFGEVIRDNKRIEVDNTLVLTKNGRYSIDFQDLEQKIIKNKIKLFIFCSPHNPVGRVWTHEELDELARICIRHQVIVVSDEIHHDFVFPGHKHHVLANLCKVIKDQVIVCTSPSKTFNLAGLQVSNIFVPNSKLRHQLKKQIATTGYSQLNTMGLVACATAYEAGEPWFIDVLTYIQENIDFVRTFLKERIPQIQLIEPDGTYLLWLDFRGLKKSEETIRRLLVEKARLWLDEGTMFGASGEGFQRINVACPRSILELAFSRIEMVLKEEQIIER